jgi:3-oxoacyl-[acyl-carrier protein] reductase
MSDLSHKVVLVTGSSRGIGAAIARRFAERGAKVALHGRDRAALAAMEARLRDTGAEVVQVVGDVTRFSELESMRRHVEDTLGPIDVLVANAGGNQSNPRFMLEEIPEEEFRASLDGNLTATFLTLKSVLPGMKQRGKGSIITLSSAASRRPTPASPIAYAAAKAGIELLTQRVALEVGPFGIRVNCIAPEAILTEANEARIPAEQRTRMVEAHPIRRLGTPDDVADAALFLASDSASWVTGVVLDVAGGSVLSR